MSTRRAIALVMVAVVTALEGCGGSSGAPTVPSTPALQFTVSGTVYNGLVDTSLGVPGATVQIATGPSAGRSTTTDASGRYRLENVPGGNLTLRVSAANYETLSREIFVTATGTFDFGLSPTAITTDGRVVDAGNQVGLPGVTISAGSVSVQSDAGGAFAITGAPGSVTSPLLLTFSSPSTVTRETSLRVPGRDAVVSLISSSFDLVSFDEMFRTPMLERWTSAPRLIVETRTGQFVDDSTEPVTTIGDSMSDAEYGSVVSDLTEGLAGLSGGTFPAFASVTRQDSAEGAVVGFYHYGAITVMRVRGMENAIGSIGLGWSWTLADGKVIAGAVMLDRDYDQDRSGDARELRQHELGHAMGYSHVETRESITNPVIGSRLDDLDRLGARIAFERPPGNVTPDNDPTSFVANPLGLGLRIKGGATDPPGWPRR